MKRILAVGYGALAYIGFLVVLAYTAGFLADKVVTKAVDDGMHSSTAAAVVIDLALLSLFAVQHSVMARPWFKRAWTKVIGSAIERTTFVAAASAVVAVLLWQWRPITDTVWDVHATWARDLLWAGYLLGWGVVVLSTFMIGHFDLFGLKQVLARARNADYREPGFTSPGLYRLVRHPIMVGFFIVFWSTPHMSSGRLLFAAVASAYIVVAVRFEEHDLRAHLGAEYSDYERRVPRFVPRPTNGGAVGALPQPR